MITILSAQYLVASMRDEFGMLPVSFVPLANQRLYVYQINILQSVFPDRKILITIPEDFSIPHSELMWLDSKKVLIQRLPATQNVGQEIVQILRLLGTTSKNILFLNGDILPISVMLDVDRIGVVESDLEPKLPIESYGKERDVHWAGVFSASDPDLLLNCLNIEDCDYYRAIKLYSIKKKLSIFNITQCYILSNFAGYFTARSAFTSERAFNSIKIKGNVLKKFSKNEKKLEKEAFWFNNTPPSLRKFNPNYFGEGFENDLYYYSIEYIGAIPLNEYFVYGRKTVVFWDGIFKKIQEFFNEARVLIDKSSRVSTNSEALFIKKTNDRLVEFANKTGFDINSQLTINGVKVPSLKKIIEVASRQLMLIKDLNGFIHGDFCLSNILFDSRTRTIKLIDPRGVDINGESMIFGSQLYDLAKLAHSVIGLYDHIVAGQFFLDRKGNDFLFEIYVSEDTFEIQESFRKCDFLPGLNTRDIEMVLPLLFIAMLPLHYDSDHRQTALLANAMRLYIQSNPKF